MTRCRPRGAGRADGAREGLDITPPIVYIDPTT